MLPGKMTTASRLCHGRSALSLRMTMTFSSPRTLRQKSRNGKSNALLSRRAYTHSYSTSTGSPHSLVLSFEAFRRILFGPRCSHLNSAGLATRQGRAPFQAVALCLEVASTRNLDRPDHPYGRWKLDFFFSPHFCFAHVYY
jgi:hypothetical protein